MEQVIRFMADVDFKYSAKRSDLVMVTQYDKHQRAQNRLEWVRAGAALMQTQNRGLAEKHAWLVLANSFLVADRLGSYSCPRDRTRMMTHNQASFEFANQVIDLEADIERSRRRRRFSHH
jgi:nitroreductase